MEIFITWLFLSIVAGIIASNKGRSGFEFFLLSIILSPLIGIILALVYSPKKDKLQQAMIDEGEHKKCPYCAELIKAEAKVCRYCGRELPVDENGTGEASGLITIQEHAEQTGREVRDIKSDLVDGRLSGVNKSGEWYVRTSTDA